MKELAQSMFVVKIQSGSMYPTLKVGDLVALQRTSFAEIDVGDIIGFTSDKGIPLVHRVVWKTTKKLTTVADASRRADHPISETAVLGKVILTKKCGHWHAIHSTMRPFKLHKLLAWASSKVVSHPSSLYYRAGRKLLLHGLNVVHSLCCWLSRTRK